MRRLLGKEGLGIDFLKDFRVLLFIEQYKLFIKQIYEKFI